MKQLILGGARSGKSALAEQLASASGLDVLYLATAASPAADANATSASDAEMDARIAMHQASRPASWGLCEEPIALAETLRRECTAGRCVLVDCLTLWLSNLMGSDDAALLDAQQQALLEVLPNLRGELLLVSNEVGLGIVPMHPEARRFRDLAGRLHQQLAQRCERVIFTVAGLPQVFKGPALQASAPPPTTVPHPRPP